MRQLLSLLPLCALSLAAQTGVTTTNTQASFFGFPVPCTLAVIDTSGTSINALNPVLSPGANQWSQGSYSIVGKHAGVFRTPNIPLGNTFYETTPVNVTLKTDNRSQRIVDPLTGLLFRRMTLPGDIADAYYWGKAVAGWWDAGDLEVCSSWKVGGGATNIQGVDQPAVYAPLKALSPTQVLVYRFGSAPAARNLDVVLDGEGGGFQQAGRVLLMAIAAKLGV